MNVRKKARDEPKEIHTGLAPSIVKDIPSQTAEKRAFTGIHVSNHGNPGFWDILNLSDGMRGEIS